MDHRPKFSRSLRQTQKEIAVTRHRLLVLLVLCCGALYSQQSLWEQNMREGNRARAEGRYPAAEQGYRAALEPEKDFGENDPHLANTLNSLAVLCYDQGRYTEAEPLFRGAIAIWEKSGESADLGKSLGNLASLDAALGHYDEAESLYQRSIEVLERALGPDDPGVGASMNNLAALDNTRGKYAAAEALARHSLEIRKKRVGAEDPDLATSLNNLAEAYMGEGRYVLAQPLLEQSLQIRHQLLPAHPDLA
jgi:tetratricopeptide (TPR) repeat protein